MNNAWQIHYNGSDTVGSVLERLERSDRQLEQAVTELGEAVQEARGIARNAELAVEGLRDLFHDARDAASEREA